MSRRDRTNPRRPNRAAARATALLLSALFVMALAEGVVRLAIGPPARMLFGFGRPFHDVQTDWDIVYGENAGGDRLSCGQNQDDEELPRIAVIGDSFVFGQGVEDCADFVSLLSDAVPSYRFRNLGLIGAGVPEYTAVARDLLEDFDGVLLVFYGNDVGRLKGGDGDSFVTRLSRHSSSSALLQKAYHAVIVRRAIAAWRNRGNGNGNGNGTGSEKIVLLDGRPNNILSVLRDNRDYFRSVVQPGPRLVAAFEERFHTLASLLEQNVGRENVLVSVVPEGHTVSKTLRKFIHENGGAVASFGEPGPAYELIRSLSEQRGFRFIDVYRDFLPEGDTLYYAHDLHWTPAGHRRMSEVVARWLSHQAFR